MNRPKNKDTEFLQDDKRQLFWEGVFGLAFAFLGWIIADVLAPPNIWVALFISLEFAILGFVCTSVIIGHFRIAKLQAAIDIISRRLGNMVEQNMSEHAAFFDSKPIKDNVIELLRRKDGGPLWIATRFLSRQLRQSFLKLQFEIDGDQYSEFSKHLYPEAEKSIFLTCPFTPVQWFQQVFPHHSGEIVQQLMQGQQINQVLNRLRLEKPPHVCSLLAAKATKRRLVILPSKDYDCLVAQDRVLEGFLKLNEEIETRFTTASHLQARFTFAGKEEFSILRNDYAVFDGEILLQWEMPSQPNQPRPLTLVDLGELSRETEYSKIATQLFDEYFNTCLTPAECAEVIQNRRKELRDQAQKSGIVPHKWAYYAGGASMWDNVARHPDYRLGFNELNALNSLLGHLVTRSSVPKWNVLHLGPGNGCEIGRVISALGERRIREYALVDISPELLYLAKSRAMSEFPNYAFRTHVCDVTTDDICSIVTELRANNLPTLILLVGNGAILSNKSVLPRIKNALYPGDRLLVTVESYEPARRDEILSQYKLPDVIKLISMPLHIFGITKDATNENFYKFDYQELHSLIEVKFLLRAWLNGHKELQEQFEGFKDEVVVFTSWRPTKEAFVELFTREGFAFDGDVIETDLHCLGAVLKVQALDDKKKGSEGTLPRG